MAPNYPEGYLRRIIADVERGTRAVPLLGRKVARTATNATRSDEIIDLMLNPVMTAPLTAIALNLPYPLSVF